MDSDLAVAFSWAYHSSLSADTVEDESAIMAEVIDRSQTRRKLDNKPAYLAKQRDLCRPRPTNVSNNAGDRDTHVGSNHQDQDVDLNRHDRDESRQPEEPARATLSDVAAEDVEDYMYENEDAILNSNPMGGGRASSTNQIAAEIDNFINEVTDIIDVDEGNDMNDQSYAPPGGAYRYPAPPSEDHPGRDNSDTTGPADDEVAEIQENNSDMSESDHLSLDYVDADSIDDLELRRDHDFHLGVLRFGSDIRPKGRISSSSRNARFPSKSNITVREDFVESFPEFAPYFNVEGDFGHVVPSPRRQASNIPDMELMRSRGSKLHQRERKNQRRQKSQSADDLILEDIRVLYSDDELIVDEYAMAKKEIAIRLRRDKNERLTRHFIKWVAEKWQDFYNRFVELQKDIDKFEHDLEATTDATLRRLLLNRISIDKSWQARMKENVNFDHLIADYRLCFESVGRNGQIALHGEAADALRKELEMEESMTPADVPPPLPDKSPPRSPVSMAPAKPRRGQLRQGRGMNQNYRICFEIDKLHPTVNMITLKPISKNVHPVDLPANREKRRYRVWSARSTTLPASTTDRRSKWQKARDAMLVKLMRSILY